ncbi:MAG: hypothetical protein PHQ43_09035 [Dehalococcoidales bacterium]|nr:hypothetical protein [Dehalococcoidales bacterium]
MAKWLILTGGGGAVRGRYEGTREQAVEYCKAHFMPKGYKIVKDKTKKLGGK